MNPAAARAFGFPLLPVSTLALVLVAGHLSAQGTVRSTRVTADFTAGDGSAVVRLDVVMAVADSVRAVEATVLDFGAAMAGALRAGSGGEVVDQVRSAPAAWTALLPVERVGGEARVHATYRVEAAAEIRGGAVRGRVPVLAVRVPPERAVPRLFHAEVRVPPGWTVREGFPTGLSPASEPGVYRVDLQVVPSLLSFRARSDGAWRPGLPLVLDTLCLGLLVAFSVVGWRHLRDPA